MNSSKHILITGGAGYLGSACTKKLLDDGYAVTVFDDLSSGQEEKIDERATHVKGDILATDALDKVFSGANFDAVLHLAALTSVPEGETHAEKYFDVNVTGTLNVLRAMKDHEVPTIVFASTAAVYMPSGSGFYDEHAAAHGANVYGASKRCAERMIEEFTRIGAIERSVILRIFNIAGDAGLHFADDSESLFPIIARAVHMGNSVHVFGGHKQTSDGSGVRDYVHLVDVVEAFGRALSHERSGTFNIGTGEGKSVLEIIKAFEKEYRLEITTTIEPPRAGDVPVAVADITYTKEMFGWQPRHTLKDIVSSMLDFRVPRV